MNLLIFLEYVWDELWAGGIRNGFLMPIAMCNLSLALHMRNNDIGLNQIR